jgi:hypothetical protein
MNIEKFDNRFFSYNVFIGDATTKNKRLLTADTISNLTITDNVFIPFISGSIIINNTRDILQADVDKQRALNFAGNNRDYLAIDIMPNVSGNLKNDYNNDELRKAFGLTYVFCINELQDSDDNASNINIMNFRDIKHQMAIENSDLFSSAQVAQKKNPDVALRDMNNSERSILTGELLKDIILRTYGIDESEQEKIIDVANFDLGATRIMWYSRSTSNAFQSMMYVNSLHQSEKDKDPCLLYYDYSINKFKNISFAKLFELQKTNPEEYVLETFIVGSGAGAKENTPDNTLGTRLRTMSNILEHKLSPLNGNEFTRSITNNVLATVFPGDRNFYFNCEDGSIKNVLKDYSKLYVDPFKNKSPNIKPSVELADIENYSFLKPKIITNALPLDYNYNVRNNMLMDLIISGGDNIVFRTVGSTHRRSGHFIDIATESDVAGSGVDNNLIGRWFIISVSHVFMGNSYYNIIEAVKTYKFEQTK